MDNSDLARVRVWDVPVRLFHWAIVLLLAFQLYSGNTGGNIMLWHAYAGYAVLTLVLFRVSWGFAGSAYARFSSFIAGPARTLEFACKLFSRQPAPAVGHNPLGGWMVVAILISLVVQAATGLFANDDIATEGPLAVLVSKDVSDRLTTIHKLNVYVLIGLSSIHIAAVLYHWIAKRENLIGAMFTGVKLVPAEIAREGARVGVWRAVVLFVAALALVYLVVQRPF